MLSPKYNTGNIDEQVMKNESKFAKIKYSLVKRRNAIDRAYGLYIWTKPKKYISKQITD